MILILKLLKGTCTFMEKLERAKKAGSAGVIVISDTDGLINPSIDKEEQEHADSHLSDVALVVLKRADGIRLLKALETSMDMSVPLSVEVYHRHSLEDDITAEDEKPRLLYINGKALINTGEFTALYRLILHPNDL